MRTINEVEANLVSGGMFLASDAFDGGGDYWCWGGDFQEGMCDVPSVYVYGGIENPNWTNVWGALTVLGGTLVAVASAPAVAAFGAVVAVGAAIGLAHQK